MSKKQQPTRKRPSKRDRKMKFFVYLMVIAMLLSMLTAGLSTLTLF